jgi:hypothetical protein
VGGLLVQSLFEAVEEQVESELELAVVVAGLGPST